ncbi:BfmA/BtgA family mobilization protein [Flagellimonas flava]|uniref:BfmA/BtgA family mobilization protein n=1 Tax=Flagellimonas flava TaxID=570519 RepID=UPI003D65ED80
MDREFKKEKFETLKIKSSVAQKFKRYSKAISKSQSMSLLAMLEFFEATGLSPEERLGPNIKTLESLLKKRINAVIAIVRDIEKNQTKPTVAMMQSLFVGVELDKKELLLEKDDKGKEQPVKFVERNQMDL